MKQKTILVANFTQAISNNKYTICIKPSRTICLKVCSNYFSTHLDVTKIVIIYFESNKVKVTTIKRTNPELKRYLENTRISDWNRTQY